MRLRPSQFSSKESLMLSMKHKLQLMQWVSNCVDRADAPTSTQELVDTAAKALGVPVTVADLKEACKNADMKWSAICSTGTSPVALLHIKVAELLKDVKELKMVVAALQASSSVKD